MKIWEILKEENVGKEVIGSNKIQYRIALGGKDDVLLFEEGDIQCKLFTQIEIMSLDFEFIQQPVTFKEVLNSDKKCRVEHEIFEQNWFKLIITDNIMAKTYLEDVCNGEYMYLKNIMYALSFKLNEEYFRKVMNEGKWYLEP